MTEDADVGYELAWRDAWDVFVATQHPPVPHETNADLVITVGFAAYQKGRAAAQEDVLFGPEVRSEIRKLFETLTGYHIGDADVTDVVDAADNLRDVVLHRPAIEAAIRGTASPLDVERLARAIAAAALKPGYQMEDSRFDARLIAREYGPVATLDVQPCCDEQEFVCVACGDDHHCLARSSPITESALAEALHDSYLRDPAMPRITWADLNDAERGMWRRHAAAILAALREQP